MFGVSAMVARPTEAEVPEGMTAREFIGMRNSEAFSENHQYDAGPQLSALFLGRIAITTFADPGSSPTARRSSQTDEDHQGQVLFLGPRRI